MVDIYDDHLRRVSAVYRHAAERGEPPLRAVVREFDRPRSTASRWIAAARQRGYLPVIAKGQHANRNAKAVAVAEALGIAYDDLVAAVRNHANGDLRV